MKNLKAIARAAAAGALLILAGAAMADEPPRGAPPPPPPPLPNEAYAACDGKSDGDACTVGFRGNKLDGTCAAANDKRLFCRPPNLPPPPQRN